MATTSLRPHLRVDEPEGDVRPQAPQREPVAPRPRRVWIDLDNTPHVPFFAPIIRELQARGHTTIVTVRDAYQTCEVADLFALAHTRVGRHYGANRLMKVGGTVWRSLQLLPVVRRARPDISMSHGSRPLVLTSSLLGIPSLLLLDYEHARRLPFVKPALGVAPAWVDDAGLAREFKYGLRTYEGLKEDVYAPSFRPDPSVLAELGVGANEILVTVRPPATEAHYHNPEAEALFVEVVNVLGDQPGVRLVILPRTAGAQRDFVRRTWPRWCAERKIVVPDRALDGLNLIWHSDLVVSGGGTMNREAAALGVPVYSIFRGRLGAVDRHLAQDGRLVLIERPEDVRSRLRPVKRRPGVERPSTQRPALQQIMQAVDELLKLGH